MSKHVVICQGDECEAENTEWEDSNGTYWFACSTCGMNNEVVYAGWK